MEDIYITREFHNSYSGAPHNGPPKAADLRTTAEFQERIETTLEAVHYEPPRSAPSEFRTTDTEVGLGGLCWHNFEHNSTPEHNGITEHNRKKCRHIYQQLLKNIVTVVTHRKSCFNIVLLDSLSSFLISAAINIIM